MQEKKGGTGMKIAEIIGLTDELRPNEYTAEMKTRWLSEVEGTVVDEILNRAEGNNISFEGYRYATDQERELLVPDRFSDIYIQYLIAKIELHDEETLSYNNAAALYQTAFDQYAAWYRRNHMPKEMGYFDIWGRGKRNEPAGICDGDPGQKKDDNELRRNR